MNDVYCVLDYETFSEANLKQVGAYEYSKHPSTDIICVAWAVGTREEIATAPVRFWSPLIPNEGTHFPHLLRALKDSKVILGAHNAFFEQCITANVFAVKHAHELYCENIPISRWRCTASYAAALSLPRKLEMAAKVLKLSSQKDMEGNRLVLKWCKPRKPTKNNPKVRHDDVQELKRIIEYCKGDVKAQVALLLKAPPLNVKEKKVWEIDQKINHRGFLVDRPLVTKILDLIREEEVWFNERTKEITLGVLESTTKRDQMLRWLESQGTFLPNLQAATIKEAIQNKLVRGDSLELLKIRQAISKTSTKKYRAFEARSKSDGRLRGSLLYWAAHHGRWAGMGVQPQNFPRGSIDDPTQAAEILKDSDLDWIRVLYKYPMEVFSSCLRSMIIPTPGKLLAVCDYAAIEARVLFWFANHTKGIEAFNKDVDNYMNLATKIFGIELKNVTGKQRFVGKQAFLGSGYQMGPPKFKKTCAGLGVEVTDEIAEAAIKAYRSEHSPVVTLWSNIQMAAFAAVKNPGKRYKINNTVWWSTTNFLWCLLPSGRKLAFYGPKLSFERTSWGDKRESLSHWGVEKGKWVQRKTYGGKLVENVVSGTARDLMAEAILRIEGTKRYEIVLSVHDELVGEFTPGVGSGKEFNKLMATLPEWAVGIPMKVEGWTGDRYRK